MMVSVIWYKLTIFNALASKGRGMRPAMLENVSSTKVPYRTLLYATFTNPQKAKRRERWFLAHSCTVADNSYLGAWEASAVL